MGTPFMSLLILYLLFGGLYFFIIIVKSNKPPCSFSHGPQNCIPLMFKIKAFLNRMMLLYYSVLSPLY